MDECPPFVSSSGSPGSGRVGFVVIGRNEGERLVRCLRSVAGRVVYVDSGSTDGSVERASSSGAVVIQLDTGLPFTMARGRNAGLSRLLEVEPDVEFVQFLDGDCELDEGWLGRAKRFLEARADMAAVAGRLRERAPDRSIYNRLCDMEWDRPAGEVDAVGGIAMMRVMALRQVGPMDASLIAGEEADLCLRLRRHGWRIGRIDAEMALHDAAMTRLGQWWRRTMRGGYAFAEGAGRHGRGPERYNVRPVLSILLWGFALPAAALAALTAGWGTPWAPIGPWMAVAAYAMLLLRIARGRLRRGDRPRHAVLYAGFCVLGKFPQLLGVATCLRGRLLGRRAGIIEYKDAGVRAGGAA